MKLQFKALSITLGLVAFLGINTSVKSGTLDLTEADNSVEISPEAIESKDFEKSENEELETTEETETNELGADEEIEDAELDATEEIEDAESTEIQTPGLESTEEDESVDSSSSDDLETEEDDTNDVDQF